MSQEIVTVELPPPTVTPMVLLQSAISNGVDPDKLGRLMELVEQWNKDRAAEQFANALTAFQRECPVVVKGRQAKDASKAVMYSYACFEDIWRVVRPLLSKHAIAVTFDTLPAEGHLLVVCKVRVGIHVETSSLTLPIPPKTARCNETQAMASATSYGKRYTICDALGIVCADQDDDARSVTETLTDEEQCDLEELCKERLEVTGRKANVEKFSAIFGGTSFATIPRARFKDACAQLRNDIDAMRKAKVTK